MKIIFLILCLFPGLPLNAQSPFYRVREILGNDNKAYSMELLDSCFRVNYEKDSVLYYKGLLRLRSGHVKEASLLYRELSNSYPAFYEAHFLNGLILFKKENYGKSADEFEVVINKNPLNLKAHYNRALALGMIEKYQNAIEELNRCIEIDPEYMQAWYSRAYWHEFLGNFTDAAADYKNVLNMDPRYLDAYLGLAHTYLKLADKIRACETINKAIEQGSQTALDMKTNFCN